MGKLNELSPVKLPLPVSYLTSSAVNGVDYSGKTIRVWKVFFTVVFFDDWIC